MKHTKLYALLLMLLCICVISVHAQDTMYIMKNNGYIAKYAVDDVDSVIFYAPPNIPANTVMDIDGNSYTYVAIGTQTWMSENLKTTKYADGTSIPHITDNSTWANLGDNNTDKAYCFYNNDPNLGYGALYSYAAATNGDNSGVNVQGVCPTGWHLPSDADWTLLETYLDDNGYAYNGETGNGIWDIGKSIATKTDWTTSTVVGAVGNTLSLNNASEFSGPPSGLRNSTTGEFEYVGDIGYWRCSTEGNLDTKAYNRSVHYSNAFIRIAQQTKSHGLSVRCIKD